MLGSWIVLFAVAIPGILGSYVSGNIPGTGAFSGGGDMILLVPLLIWFQFWQWF